jgi:DNA-binding XRE family transcriptional regulator
MKNRVQLFRKAKHWTQVDLAFRVGVNRECIDAIEKERVLSRIALAYNIAAALEIYVYEVFPPQGPTPCPLPQSSGSSHQVPPAISRESSFHSGGLK